MNIVIGGKNNWKQGIRELMNYRDLFYYLAWRDIKVRYKQTAIGILWAFFVPIVTMVVFTVFFGTFAGIESDNIPYPIFVYTGLVFWTFFSQAVTNSSNSLVANQNIIKKIYFPNIILPASSILVSLIDFAISALILVVMMMYYQFVPHWQSVIVVPLTLIITYCTSLGLGLLLSAINVKYRDVRYIVPFFIQILLFTTPVIYPSSIVSEKYQWVLNLNPMTGVIENTRAAVLNQTAINWETLIIGMIISISLLIFSLFYFKKTERGFADII